MKMADLLRFSPGVFLSLVLAAACGAPDDGAEEAAFPSRDWSGSYALAVLESSTDCAASQAPPPLSDAVLDVSQSVDNTALVRIPPLVEMEGRFEGDRLEADGSIRQPISLPESIAARAAPEDSLETIGYTVEAEFADEGLEARYAVRAPDLNALSAGSGAGRCEYVYEVRGTAITGGQPRREAPPAGSP
ncbi:MAG TPA: hypothetical protein VJ788_09340 [Gemmatimonadota bacterium]|nr:hypothetical protein [Gemmatimonadota bacterium]